MKYILFFFTTIFGAAITTTAQISNNNQPDCRIWYSYDAAGQRITRYYECKEPIDGVHEQPDLKINATAFPNPTDGPVIVVVDVDADEFSASLFTIDGAFVTGNSCLNCRDMHLTLAGHPSASYILQVTAVKEGYPQLNEGYTIIKHDE